MSRGRKCKKKLGIHRGFRGKFTLKWWPTLRIAPKTQSFAGGRSEKRIEFYSMTLPLWWTQAAARYSLRISLGQTNTGWQASRGDRQPGCRSALGVSPTALRVSWLSGDTSGCVHQDDRSKVEEPIRLCGPAKHVLQFVRRDGIGRVLSARDRT